VTFGVLYTPTIMPMRKLGSKRLGPFMVFRPISPYAHDLELPMSMWIHRVQPISVLEPVVHDPLFGQQVVPPPPVEVDGEEEYQVSSVEDGRVYRNQLQHLSQSIGDDSLT